MDKHLLENFKGRYVILGVIRTGYNSSRNDPFKLFGTIEEITDEHILFYSDRMGIIPLSHILFCSEINKEG